MCTPQPVHAYRWIVALGSTTFSLSPFALTLSLSRGATATCENVAPAGFQHLVQPQTWLWALCPLIDTATFLSEHLQYSVPPAKFAAAGLMPLSTAGWMETLAIVDFLLSLSASALAIGAVNAAASQILNRK